MAKFQNKGPMLLVIGVIFKTNVHFRKLRKNDNHRPDKAYRHNETFVK